MVSEREHEGKKVFVCDICGFGYSDRSKAQSCEDYCAKHKSCSIEITKDAVYTPEPRPIQ
jgi:hypothetical protein